MQRHVPDFLFGEASCIACRVPRSEAPGGNQTHPKSSRHRHSVGSTAPARLRMYRARCGIVRHRRCPQSPLAALNAFGLFAAGASGRAKSHRRQGWRPPACRRRSPLRSRAICPRHVENAEANNGTSLDGVPWSLSSGPRGSKASHPQAARGRSALRTIAPGRSSCGAVSTLTCSSALTAGSACGSWPPSCSRAPSIESSVISVFPQTLSSSRLRGHLPSSTTPGLVECARP
jgi:hypothetical protein